MSSPPGKAALDSAGESLQVLRREAERAGWSLVGVPTARVQAAAEALNAATLALRQQHALAKELYSSADTCTAVVQLVSTALRDVEGAHSEPTDKHRAVYGLLQALSALLDPHDQGWLMLPQDAVAVRVRLSLALLRADALPVVSRLLQRTLLWLRANGGGDAGGGGGGGGGSNTTAVAAIATAGAAGAAAAVAAAVAAAPVTAMRAAAERVVLCLESTVAALSCASYGVLLAADLVPESLAREAHAALVRSLHASGVLEHLCRLRLEAHALQRRLYDAGAAQRDGDFSFTLAAMDEVLPFVIAGAFCDATDSAFRSPAKRATGGGSLPPEQRLQLRAIIASPSAQLYALWILAARRCSRTVRLLYGTPAWLAPMDRVRYRPALNVAAALATAAMWDVHAAAGGGSSSSGASGSSANPPRLCIAPAQLARLLCETLSDVDGSEFRSMFLDSIATRAFVHTAELCCALLLPGASTTRCLQPGERAKLLRAVWAAVATAVRNLACLGRVMATGSRLLRMEGLGAAGDALPASDARPQRSSTAGPAVPRVPAPPLGPALSLRCALDAGLLRGIEEHVRAQARSEASGGTIDVLRVEMLLRQSGAWPAVLAHGDVREVAALAVTLGKAFAHTCSNPESDWRLLLLGLLEQTVAALSPGAGGGGGAADRGAATRAAGAAAGAPSSGLASAARSCHGLRLNAAMHTGMPDGEAWPPPDLVTIARLGGCPPAGSPAAQQQRTLAAFVLVEWLPLLTTHQRRGAAALVPQEVRTPRLPLVGEPCCAELTLVLLHWMAVATRECLHARKAAAQAEAVWRTSGAGASEQDALAARSTAESWSALLCEHAHVSAAVLKWTLQLLSRSSSYAAHEGLAALLPACLDLLELLVCAVPEAMLLPLPRRPFPDIDRTAGDLLTGRMGAAQLQRQGRGPLLSALRQLTAEAAAGLRGLPPGWQPPEPLRVHLRSPQPGLGPGQPPLPAPKQVATLLPRCGYPACVSFEGDSEAHLPAWLQTCGRCRAVRYCSAACQRAHWAVAHRTECAATPRPRAAAESSSGAAGAVVDGVPDGDA